MDAEAGDDDTLVVSTALQSYKSEDYFFSSYLNYVYIVHISQKIQVWVMAQLVRQDYGSTSKN